MTVRVGYLTKRFPRLSETFILDEILGLEAAGVELCLYALGDPGEEIVQPDVARVRSPVVYLHPPGGFRERAAGALAALGAHLRLAVRAPRRYLGVVAYIARKRRHLSTLRHFVEAGRLAVRCSDDGVGHLHAAFAHGPASVAHFVHLLTGLPFSFAAHAKDLYVSAPDLLARKIAAAELVLACSRSVAGELRAIAGTGAAAGTGAGPGKVVLAYHGVDTERFKAAGPGAGAGCGPLRLLAVGRLVEKKGYPVLLEALAIVLQSGRQVTCSIIGSGPRRAQLAEAAERLGIERWVSFLGGRTHEQVASAYRAASIFVQASIVLADGDRDGVPNSLLEAMASGLAVVASDVAGIPEALAPGCGLLVPAGEARALADGLIELCDHPELRSRMGQAARRHVVEHFDRARLAVEVASLFGGGPGGQALAGGRSLASATLAS